MTPATTSARTYGTKIMSRSTVRPRSGRLSSSAMPRPSGSWMASDSASSDEVVADRATGTPCPPAPRGSSPGPTKLVERAEPVPARTGCSRWPGPSGPGRRPRTAPAPGATSTATSTRARHAAAAPRRPAPRGAVPVRPPWPGPAGRASARPAGSWSRTGAAAVPGSSALLRAVRPLRGLPRRSPGAGRRRHRLDDALGSDWPANSRATSSFRAPPMLGP